MSSGDTTTRANSILGHQGCEDYESCGIVVKVGDGVMAIDIPKRGEHREPLGSG